MKVVKIRKKGTGQVIDSRRKNEEAAKRRLEAEIRDFLNKKREAQRRKMDRRRVRAETFAKLEDLFKAGRRAA